MKHLIALTFALSALVAPMAAFAQFSTDSSADTVLLADETFSSNGKITLTGQADIRQGDVRLLADKVGDVVLLQEDSVVTGTRLNYNLTTREAKVLGNCNGRKCGKNRRVAILIRSTDSTGATN